MIPSNGLPQALKFIVSAINNVEKLQTADGPAFDFYFVDKTHFIIRAAKLETPRQFRALAIAQRNDPTFPKECNKYWDDFLRCVLRGA